MTGFIIYKNEDMGIVLIEVLNSSLYDLRDAELKEQEDSQQ